MKREIVLRKYKILFTEWVEGGWESMFFVLFLLIVLFGTFFVGSYYDGKSYVIYNLEKRS